MSFVTLYRRNAKNKIIFWEIIPSLISSTIYDIRYGEIYGNTFRTQQFKSDKRESEIKSKIKEKRKIGYKDIYSLYDNTPETFEYEEDRLKYLETYLPKYNTTGDDKIIPMLCKTLKDNNPFKSGVYFGQPKINGLRCTIGCEKCDGNLFINYKYTYTSREGNPYNNVNLDEELNKILPNELKALMIEEDVLLDGELYVPGYPVNAINSFVKSGIGDDIKLQFWCYDLCIEDTPAITRQEILHKYLGQYSSLFCCASEHLNFNKSFNLLGNTSIHNITEAINYRDIFIEKGFEGLVIRDVSKDYGFGGARSNRMLKFKKIEDGYFKIIDIVPEGKRVNLPKFICRNDINDEMFECTINLPQSDQEVYLINKTNYIGKSMLVEYRERSGVKMVPFHAKGIKVVN